MDTQIYHVEQLLASSYIKFQRLGELINQSYAGSNCTEINFFVDLYSLLKPLYAGNYWTHRTCGRLDIAAGILNLCIHYRSFFKHLGVKSNIYLIYGLNCPASNLLYTVNNYNKKFMLAYSNKPEMTEIITRNLEAVNLITQYLPGIYFFDIGRCEVSAMMYRLLGEVTNPQKENIILSKDSIPLQLIPSSNVRILRPFKTKDGDVSFIVDNTNLWERFISSYRQIQMPESLIPNNFFQNVLCMTSLPERSLYSIFSLKKVFRMIQVLLNQNILQPSVLYSQQTLNTALNMLEIEYNPIDLEMRFKAINPIYQASYILPLECPEYNTIRFIDLDDPQSLREIVSRYFIDTPIDLDKF